MLCLSLLPTAQSGLAPVDVEIFPEPGATVGDLAEALGAHLVGAHSRTLLAPVTDGRPWPAARPLVETSLRSGQLIAVESVPTGWLRERGAAAAQATRAVIEVLAGPDAGLIVPLTGDAAAIGRASGATVTLSDPQVSRQHAHLLLDGEPVLVDDGSSAGTVVGDRAIRRPTPIAYGESFRVGDSILVLRDTVTAIHDGGEPGTEAITRTPRFGLPTPEAELALPSPPSKPSRQHFPWAMMTMPVVLGASMMTTMGFGRSLYYLLGWPIAMVVGHFLQRRQQMKEYEEDLAGWRDDCRFVAAEAEAAAAAQRAAAFADEPDVADLPRRLATRHLVWVRRIDDDDFLTARVGTGRVPARTVLTAGGGLPPADVRDEIRELVAGHATMENMPVTVDLKGSKVIAITGPDAAVDRLVTNLLLRLAIAHSPFDLSLCAALAPARRGLEGVLRWLPHTRPRPGTDASVTLGPAEGRALVESLASAPGGQQLVCVIDENAGVPRRLLESVAEANDTVTLVWLGASRHRAPAATGAVVDLVGGDLADGPAVLLRDRGGVLPLDEIEGVDLPTAWNWARSIAAFKDVAAIIPPDNALPGSVRFTEMGTDLADLDDDRAILARWRAARGLRAAIGMGIDGLVSLDLREDGPHGLVAGTTGSGKSELLQSLIVSLAANNPPSRITFLLVDYKGGAAFRECAQLPHTVGYITDLTPALVQRALISMNAELTWREELLARYGAKDLVALERSHPEAAPPSMLICVDEFAALLAEIPDFIDGMVSIAQRGRSLGMHMLLATQRPSGVISDQIKANTDLRIALRVASTDDSTDVIDTKDAAAISRRTPGRAWIRRTGHGSCELVQVAFVGGREPIDGAAAPVTVRAHSAFGAAAAGFGPGGAPAAAALPVHERTDLDRLVRTITRAHKSSGAADPRLPWLPALPEVLVPGDLPTSPAVPVAESDGAPDSAAAGTSTGRLTLGLIDEPATQGQRALDIDLGRVGNVLIYGASGSGKSVALRTVAEAALRAALDQSAAAPTLVYGIDAAGGALANLADLPHVGTVVPLPQIERVFRLLRMMKRAVDERNALLAGQGAPDVGVLAARGVAVPRILLVIDNLPSVLDTLESGNAARRVHAAILQTVLQDGRRCGIHVIATSPQRSGIPMQAAATFGARIVLRMTGEDDYQMLGVPHRMLSADSVPGRGLVGKLEVQLASAAHTDPIAVANLVTLWTERHGGTAAPAVPAMPDRVPAEALPAPADGLIYIGVDADLVTAVGLPAGSAPLLISGRSRSGRTSTLVGIAAQWRRMRPDLPVAVIAPRPDSRSAWQSSDVTLVTGADEFEAWAEKHLASSGESAAPGELRCGLIVDDLHLWEGRFDEADMKPTMTRLTALVQGLFDGTVAGVGVAVATASDQLREGAVKPALTAAFRRARRAALLNPTDSDGMFFGCDVPSQPVEPLVGVGRALLAESGRGRVVQLVG